MNSVVMKSGSVPRYAPGERVNHWIGAVLFLFLAASGLAFFHPAFWFLSALLGGGSWARVLHPFLGVLMFISFGAMTLRYWRENLIQPYDREWNKRFMDVINNRDDNMPEIDKFNMGQKRLFWSQVGAIALLLVTGVIMWRPWFAGAFPIPLIRLASLVHALSFFVLAVGIIIHIYATFWVKGTLRAMTRGNVSHGWARRHHPLWYRRMIGGGK
jgi:formate dehydrogenase subunit gamma